MRLSTSIKNSLFISLFVFFPSNLFCDDVGELFERIRVKAEDIFQIKKLDFTIETSLGMRDISEVSASDAGTYGAVKVVVPIRSKTERIQILNNKKEFLQQASECVRVVRLNRRKIQVMEEEIKRLQPIMNDEGIKSVKEYFLVLNESLVLNEDVEDSLRKLKIMAGL